MGMWNVVVSLSKKQENNDTKPRGSHPKSWTIVDDEEDWDLSSVVPFFHSLVPMSLCYFARKSTKNSTYTMIPFKTKLVSTNWWDGSYSNSQHFGTVRESTNYWSMWECILMKGNTIDWSWHENHVDWGLSTQPHQWPPYLLMCIVRVSGMWIPWWGVWLARNVSYLWLVILSRLRFRRVILNARFLSRRENLEKKACIEFDPEIQVFGLRTLLFDRYGRSTKRIHDVYIAIRGMVFGVKQRRVVALVVGLHEL